MPTTLAILLARIRLPALAALLGLVLTARFIPGVPGGWPWLTVGGLVLVLVRAGTVRREPVPVRPPVTGEWRALNSPASRVPSHGVQAYGQGYAIDLVYDLPGDPAAGGRPGFAWRPLARRPQEYPGFGQPVFAPADGTVVRVHDRERDHRSRTSPLGLAYVFTVELLRELFGPSRVIGNHVVIDMGGGVYAALAHLRRGSVRVVPGQRVRGGDPIAECGNSGNTTEPHLHFQVMDRPGVAFAAGLPLQFTTPDGRPMDTPRNGARFLAGQPDDRLAVGRVGERSDARDSVPADHRIG
jgi:murein DD-endopeptidase MepM/ murein hydrolase activator NlpD